jgi:4-hydroxybenzoate polyprenyltransferase
MRAFKRMTEYLRMIRFSHSIFALPFAYSGMILANKHSNINFFKILWITLAMVSARSAAMGFNRLVDRKYDENNPRTSSRAIPEGRINIGSVKIFIIISLIIFFLSAGMLNTLAFALSPVAVFITFIYSFSKRFTLFSHYILGLSLGIAPIGAWIGVTGKIDIISLMMSLAVMLWVAGFDIIYSILDIRIDKLEGLKSIPSVLGIPKSLWISRISHLLAFIIFIYIYMIISNLLISLFFLSAILIMLLYQHIFLKPEDPKSVDRVFFLGNSVISIMFFTGILISYIFLK